MLRGLKKDGPRGLAQSVGGDETASSSRGNAAAKGNNDGMRSKCGARVKALYNRLWN
jgi:hypothetical protein